MTGIYHQGGTIEGVFQEYKMAASGCTFSICLMRLSNKEDAFDIVNGMKLASNNIEVKIGYRGRYRRPTMIFCQGRYYGELEGAYDDPDHYSIFCQLGQLICEKIPDKQDTPVGLELMLARNRIDESLSHTIGEEGTADTEVILKIKARYRHPWNYMILKQYQTSSSCHSSCLKEMFTHPSLILDWDSLVYWQTLVLKSHIPDPVATVLLNETLPPLHPWVRARSVEFLNIDFPADEIRNIVVKPEDFPVLTNYQSPISYILCNKDGHVNSLQFWWKRYFVQGEFYSKASFHSSGPQDIQQLLDLLKDELAVLRKHEGKSSSK